MSMFSGEEESYVFLCRDVFMKVCFFLEKGFLLNVSTEMRFQKGKVLKLKRVMACICKVFKEIVVQP